MYMLKQKKRYEVNESCGPRCVMINKRKKNVNKNDECVMKKSDIHRKVTWTPIGLIEKNVHENESV